MYRNVEGLKRSARLRREGALARTTAALQRMEIADREINFRTVAAEAGVSTAWLYGQQELRLRIIRSRKSQGHATPPPSASQGHERLSRQSVVATLRLRIKTLEAKNRELAEMLECAYGAIAVGCHHEKPCASVVRDELEDPASSSRGSE